MKKEIEAKFLDINKDEVRKNLQNLEFSLLCPERLMKRKAFHFQDDLKTDRMRWARVRDEGNKITMTVKEVKTKDDINGVFESEVIIDSFEEGVNLLKSVGMMETSYQETYREEWIRKEEEIHITIDTWPHLNPFIEIEASDAKMVKYYAKKLEFNFKKALFGGVDIIYGKVHNIKRKVICAVPRITFDITLEEMLKETEERLKIKR
jgi:adenylate cyclase, class 2